MAQLNPADRKAARELAAKLNTPGITSYGGGLILKWTSAAEPIGSVAYS